MNGSGNPGRPPRKKSDNFGRSRERDDQAGFYGLAALGGWSERRGRRPPRVAYLPYYLCKVNVAALHGMVEAARRRDVTLWQRVRRGDEAGA